jgi:SAM domain (Sterile alpha motif)
MATFHPVSCAKFIPKSLLPRFVVRATTQYVMTAQVHVGDPSSVRKLGLGQYAHRFAENDITFAILLDLTDQDLEKIGVASLGHRRQLLRAIGELKSAPGPCTMAAAPIAPHDAVGHKVLGEVQELARQHAPLLSPNSRAWR